MKALSRLSVLFSLSLISLSVCADGFLVFPQPPDSLPKQRKAEWIVTNYWKGADFGKATEEEVEQAFVDYVTILQIAPAKAFVDIPRQAIIATLADKYLNDADSPLFDKGLYSQFVRGFVGDSLPDFPILQDGGRNMISALIDTMDGETTVVMYDPDCDECMALMGQLIGDGVAHVIAVNLNPEAKWPSASPTPPASWGLCTAADVSPYKLLPIRRLPFVLKLKKRKQKAGRIALIW